MSSLRVVQLALAAYILLMLWECYTGWRKKRLRYAIKRSINHFRPLFYVITGLCFLLWMVYLIAPINEWAEAASAKQTTDLGAIIINLALLGFICVLIGILTWWIKLSGKLWIQYNEQEMEWQLELQKASKAKWDKWPKYLRWLSKFNG